MPKIFPRLAEVTMVVALLGRALWTFAGQARSADFYGDEGKYLARTLYFRLFFLEHDFTNPDWNDENWVHTQPMLGNYVVGAWLWARGFDLNKMPEPYK